MSSGLIMKNDGGLYLRVRHYVIFSPHLSKFTFTSLYLSRAGGGVGREAGRVAKQIRYRAMYVQSLNPAVDSIDRT